MKSSEKIISDRTNKKKSRKMSDSVSVVKRNDATQKDSEPEELWTKVVGRKEKRQVNEKKKEEINDRKSKGIERNAVQKKKR